MKQFFILVLTGLMLAGCATVAPQVVANATSFYVPDFTPSGSVIVIAGDPEVNRTLEFGHYKKKFEDQLVANGFVIAENELTADYVAYVTYGIDDGTSKTVSTPLFGQTGGGTTYTSGTVSGAGGTASYSGTSYSMPTYGYVGSITGSRTTYKRAVALDIVNAGSLKDGKANAVYEGRIKSEGSCNMIGEVFDEMLQVLFTDWPGESGQNRNLSVPSTVDC